MRQIHKIGRRTLKRLGKLLLLPLAMLLTVSCQTFIDNVTGGGSKIAAVLAMLENEGYVDIDENNDEDTRQYNETQIQSKYDLNVDVIGFYQGYVPPQTRWAKILVFANITHANGYHAALLADVTESGHMSIWDTIVLQTASQETFDAFELLKNSSATSSQVASTTSTATTSTVASSTNSSATSQSNGDYLSEAQMLTILYDAGYRDIDEDNDQGTRDFRQNRYFEYYGLTVTITAFYHGYIPPDNRYMLMDVFLTVEMATAVTNALNSDTEENHDVKLFIHQEGRIVVQSDSPQTWALFN